MGKEVGPRKPPRVTIRALQLLPLDSFPNDVQRGLIRDKRWRDLSIGEVDHPLLQDARKRFAQGLPDPHKAATKAAGRNVYEVRSWQGAAWRGAVVVDDDGTPWLIWAEKHDRFHDRVAKVLGGAGIDGLLPVEVEYKLLAREEATQRHVQWRRSAVQILLTTISEALEDSEQSARAVVPDWNSESFTLEVELDHDTPTGTPDEDESLVIMAQVRGNASDDFITCVLPALQPDRARIEAHYRRDSTLEFWVTVTQAELSRIAAASALTSEGLGAEPLPEPASVLHYVDKLSLTEHLVLGKASRGICGQWFVPTQDEQSALPVCPKCESVKPAAQHTTDLIRRFLATR